MEVNNARQQFRYLAKGLIHLNHAGVSPLSTPVANAMIEYINGMSEDAVACGAWAWRRYFECHDAFARIMGVDAQHVALTKNTAHGVSIVADGLKWEPGDEVVFADCEYPANTYPWLAQQDRGVVARIVPTRADGTIPVEDYASHISSRTRVIAVSWVQFATGYRSNLESLAKLAHDNGALLVVDVIQGLGAMPLNLTEAGVDIAATGSQKWLMGPVGAGALYVNPSVLDQIRLVNMGSGSVINALAFDPLGFTPKHTAQRYEEGTPNVTGGLGVKAAIEFLEHHGIDKISTRILSLTRQLMNGLWERGYTVLSPETDSERAGIVLFRHAQIANETIIAALAQAGIHVADRGGKVRFAPHFYISEEEIDRTLNTLPKFTS
ncbi:MAG: aminotransferase class V-fold PLP-dependent enzyme [Capsulimonadaceae bacterium]|nr:aminotransferase class V-fold PLP-dependent enzyme [Capsulimonadaceae bacterium]